jgi:serine phosphatase RsbU (regulator of sigma subunit)/anti-sigma regulatory factor (Ser/Thr protein kinase)
MFRNVKKELIAIPAQMSYLSQVRDFIEHVGRKYKYTDKITNSFKLVIEEACTNIIRHGYRDIKGGEITLKAIIRRQSLMIVIIDQGISFDPRQAATPDLQKYIQIGKKGGLGIFMMRKLMDDVQYNITSRGNELRLTKQRESIPNAMPVAWWEGLTMRTRHTIQASVAITLIAIFIVFILNENVYESTIEGVIESTQAQALTLAENSSDPIQRDQDLRLFEFAEAPKNSYPNIIYETFIIDLENDILSSSTPAKALGEYNIPEDATIVKKDSLHELTILKYSYTDSLTIYDFQAPVYANPILPSRVIGWVHIWVPEEYVLSKISNTRLIILLYMAGILIIAFVGMYFLVDRIVKPFHSLADWVHDVGQGTVDEDEIDIDASDELGEIAQAFNMMTSKFREAQVGLIEQQRLQKELQVAQEIQQMLLPSDFPDVKGYELASFYEAAKEVGGDLFDFVEVDNDTIGICVADVAGKGVPGSLIMTMIRTALRLEARGNKNPADVLAKVNRFVTDDMKRGMFVTMFYLVLDSRNRIIHYASAGHNPMILYRGSSKQTYYLNPSGFPVGIQLPDINLFDQRIETESIRLHEDDMLVLYTDGVTEAMNIKRELYRDERFLEAIRNNSHFEVSEFIKAVRDDIKGFTQNYPQNDDITYVAIKEKLMQGEVLYSIQRDLFHMIEEEGFKVKEACEKMQVSPYMYRKYKKIKDSVGMEGLKELLFSDDYIEKKHLSIEDRTKIYDVIAKYPDYGAKRISWELNTELYGYTKLDSNRVYNELKKAKLNTQEKRENYIRRGGKKRIKAPGTPLMTLDGKVILDFESSEQQVSKTHGEQAPDTRPFTPTPTAEPESKTKELNLTSVQESAEKAKTKTAGVEEKKEESVADRAKEDLTAETNIRAESKKEETKSDEQIPDAEKEEITKEKSAGPEPKIAAESIKETIEEEEPVETVPEESLPSDSIKEMPAAAKEAESKPEEERKTRVKEPELPISLDEYLKAVKSDGKDKPTPPKIIPSDDDLRIDLDAYAEKDEKLVFGTDDDIVLDSESADESDENEIPESLGISDGEMDVKVINTFYQTVADDIQIITQLVSGWGNGDITEKDLSKIKLSMRIMITHPLLKQLGHMKQLFTQVQKGVSMLETNFNHFLHSNTTQNAKEMLKYIEKENILKNKDILLKQINEIGIKQHSLRAQIAGKTRNNAVKLDSLREKIEKKNLIKDVSLLDSLQKNNRG